LDKNWAFLAKSHMEKGVIDMKKYALRRIAPNSL